MKKLPVPPVVGQLVSRLPDGNIDPDAATDCGESCVASISQALHGMEIGPGCVRQALGLTKGVGTTYPSDLERYLSWITSDTWATTLEGDALNEALHHLRHFGRYAVLLGDWVGRGVGHWVLAYEWDKGSILVMDPWSARLLHFTPRVIQQHGWGSQVWCGR